jgi:ribosomal protein S12 methylthiotransferase
LVPPEGLHLTPRHYAYLKISEGCNNSCSFCIIPSLRGKLASRPIAEVLREAERLVRAGVKEILVISQDTSAYGLDLKHEAGDWKGGSLRTHMTDLARALGDLGAWIRLHYVYPYPHVDDIIPLMAEGKILPYLDIPFQHASPRVLKAMRRPANQDKTLARLSAWRESCPDLAIRSTFIVGFPGETEEDFEMLLAFLKEAEIDRLGCFKYEAVEGAAANALAGAVPEAVKQERHDRLMGLQQQISTRRLARKIGRTLDVLIDAVDEDGAIARSYAEAPEIDGNVFIAPHPSLEAGEIVRIRIEEADEYDLYARVAG